MTDASKSVREFIEKYPPPWTRGHLETTSLITLGDIADVLNALPALLAERDRAEARITGLQERASENQVQRSVLTCQRDGLVKILEEVLPEVTCRCDKAYTSRGRHEPNALCYLEAPIKAALAAAKETNDR